MIDTQSVKTSTNPPTTTQGIDAAKLIAGRKRSIATDTLGLLLAVIVCAAPASPNKAGVQVLDQANVGGRRVGCDYAPISSDVAVDGSVLAIKVAIPEGLAGPHPTR